MFPPIGIEDAGHKGDMRDNSEAMQQVDSEGGRPQERGNAIILTIDDDENDAFLLRSAFRKTGFAGKLQVAMDGQEAIDKLKASDNGELPDLILLDLKMPRVNGFEVIHWIRRQEKLGNVPVAILTSSNHEEDVRNAYAGGADVYLVKPSTYDELVALARALGQVLEKETHDATLLERSPAYRPKP